MKTKVSLFLLAVLALSGCAKDNVSDPERIQVTLKVSAPLSVDEAPFTKAGTSDGPTLPDLVSTIYYTLAKNNALVISGSQVSTAADFGTIALDLEAGTYDLFLFGVSSTQTGSFEYTPAGIVSSNEISCKDQEFYSSNGQVTISVSDNVIDKTLSRSVAGLVFNITDDVPENVATVAVSYTEKYRATGASLYLQNDSYNFTRNFTIQGGKLEQLRSFVLPQTLYSIKVTAYDSSKNKLIEKTIADLSVVANKRYTISGTLFESLDDRDFSIKIDDNWTSEEAVNL